MAYKSIVFDLDGTILDSEKVNAVALLELLIKKAEMTHLTMSDLIPKMGQTGSNILRAFGVADENIDEYLAEWIEYTYNESQKPMELFEGILPVIETLHDKKIPMGIVSSKSREVFKIEQQHFSFEQYFSHIVLSDDTSFHKPHPAPLLKYLELSGFQAKDCIYIGDTYSDLTCAKECGVDFGLACWGAASLFEHETHIKRFSLPQEILQLI